jgi:hypothetical protein
MVKVTAVCHRGVFLTALSLIFNEVALLFAGSPGIFRVLLKIFSALVYRTISLWSWPFAKFVHMGRFLSRIKGGF